MNTWKKYLQRILLKQRGQNQQLVDDIIQHLPENSQERLFQILRDMDNEITLSKRKSHMYGHIAHLYARR